MGKALTPTELRANLYRVLDEILATGEPREVVRGGRRLLILPADGPRLRLEDLPRREATTCSPDELVATTWEYVPDEGA